MARSLLCGLRGCLTTVASNVALLGAPPPMPGLIPALVGAGTLALQRFFSPSLKVVQPPAPKTRPIVRLADQPEMA